MSSSFKLQFISEIIFSDLFLCFQFLATFFTADSLTHVGSDKDRALIICNACHIKLDNFKLFWLQYKTNVNLLNVFRHRQIQHQQQQQKQVIKTEEDTKKELGCNPLLDDVIRQRLGSLKPLDFSVPRGGSSEDDNIPDTSTHPEDDPDLSPRRLVIPDTEARGEDRRRQRNREASRRYRERARTNPELLRRMREQQNARQKKYYARLRQRKQSSTSSLVNLRK